MAKISQKHLEIITETAVKTALEYYEKEKMKQENQKHNRRLRNVKLLLRNYRSLTKHVKDIKLEIDELNEKFELTYLDSDEFKIQSIKRSKEKTLAMLRYVDKMLTVYKVMCEQSGDERRYETIYSLYISENKKTAEEISALQSVAVRTVFNDVEKASKDLAVLMFGVDGIKFDK